MASKTNLHLARITGNEPTITKNHLIKVIELLEESNILFILETNGILIGANREYAELLSKYNHVHVRVSLKAADEQGFERLTGAEAKSFNLQLKALQNLDDFGASYHPAIMASFLTEMEIMELKERLKEINRILPSKLEIEYAILYPPVIERLQRAGIKPYKAIIPKQSKYICKF